MLIATYLFAITSLTSDERNSVKNIAKYIEKEYGHFENNKSNSKFPNGKTIYYSFGSHLHNSTLSFYEITDAKEMNNIENLTKKALVIYNVDEMNLIFYEKQNWITDHNGTRETRVDEKIIKKMTVYN